MKQPLYIKAATAISPQHSFADAAFLEPVCHYDNGKLRVVDVAYNKYISPVAIRRMSRIMKMAISAAMQCLIEAAVSVPDAIITGTGRGSISDMERFLNDMIDMNEGALNPTFFIQSTYNSPNGWIAMQTKSTAYNQTYVHRGCSLELAMLDAQLILAEATETKNLLVGSYDEISDDYFIVKQKIGYWKEQIPDNTALLEHSATPGTIGGEGSAFFTFSNERGNAISIIEDLVLVQHSTKEKLLAEILALLERNNLATREIDVLLTGKNGDSRQEPMYLPIIDLFGEGTTAAAFKHLCGEYDTATGFGIWLADKLLKKQQIPEMLIFKKGNSSSLKHILLVNHYILGSASVLLVSLAD